MSTLLRTLALAVLLAAPGLAQRTFVGRFVDLEGEPIPKVEVRHPETGKLFAVSDDTGNVRVKLPRDLGSVAATLEGYVDSQWAVSRRGGDLVLHRPATLTGRVVDSRGEQWSGRWTIGCVPVGLPRARPRNFTVDLDQGEFRLEGLPAAELQVWVGEGETGQRVTLDAEAPTFVELEAGQTLTVEAMVPPGDLRSRDVTVRLFDGDTEVTQDAKFQRARYAELHSGPYRLLVEAPGCEPYEVEDVRASERLHRCQLRGLVTVRLLVDEPALLTGAHYGSQWGAWGNARPVPSSLTLDVAPGTGGVSVGLVDGRRFGWSLDTEAGDEVELRLDLAAMRPGTLRVLGKGGLPVVGAPVEFEPIFTRMGRRQVILELQEATSNASGAIPLPPTPLDDRCWATVDWGRGLVVRHEWSNPGNMELVRPPTGIVSMALTRALTEEERQAVRLHSRGHERIVLRSPGAPHAEIEVPGIPGSAEVFAGKVSLIVQRRGAYDDRIDERILATLDLEPGSETRLELDPDWLHAGAVSIQAVTDGETLDGSRLKIHAPAGWPHPWQDFPAEAMRRVAYLTPGAHRVVVSARDGTWAARVDVDAELRKARAFRIDIERVGRSVRFLDDEGRPIARKRVRFERTLLGVELRGGFRTDEEGRALVAMVPGEVTFKAARVAPLVMEWGMETEPIDVRFEDR